LVGWLVGYGESLGALGASVNTILELSFQKIGDFLSFNENAGSFISIGENDQRSSRSAESVDGEKRGFVGLEVARLADGVACHGGERLTAAGGHCKNSFVFYAKKKDCAFFALRLTFISHSQSMSYAKSTPSGPRLRNRLIFNELGEGATTTPSPFSPCHVNQKL